MSASFEGRTAVVSGAAAGIGRRVATRLAEAGAFVLVADVHDPDETVRLIRTAGGRAEPVLCDVRDEASVQALRARARELFGERLDVLVNNAGVNGEARPFTTMTVERWEETMRVNLTGMMLVTRELIPALAAVGGRIVNFSSNVGRRGLAMRADYVCSKWAILGLTQTLALELAPLGIRVNAVCPGPVEGDRIEQLLEAHGEAEGVSADEIRRRWAAEAPLGRFVEPDEVADVVLFLAGDAGSSLTGQGINVAAGLIMT